MIDLLIRNAEIFDGTGVEPVKGNLAIDDGKVVAFGPAPPEAPRGPPAAGAPRGRGPPRWDSLQVHVRCEHAP